MKENIYLFYFITFNLKKELGHDLSGRFSKKVTLKFFRLLPNLTTLFNEYDLATGSSSSNIAKYSGLTLTYLILSDFKTTFCALIILLLILFSS